MRNIVNYAGTLVLDQIAYDAYGNKITESAPAHGDRYGYTGEEWDSVLQLQYNRARYYDPLTGRWDSQDPIQFDGGDSNLYCYVHNDPVSYVDPSGLERLLSAPIFPNGTIGPPSPLFVGVDDGYTSFWLWPWQRYAHAVRIGAKLSQDLAFSGLWIGAYNSSMVGQIAKEETISLTPLEFGWCVAHDGVNVVLGDISPNFQPADGGPPIRSLRLCWFNIGPRGSQNLSGDELEARFKSNAKILEKGINGSTSLAIGFANERTALSDYLGKAQTICSLLQPDYGNPSNSETETAYMVRRYDWRYSTNEIWTSQMFSVQGLGQWRETSNFSWGTAGGGGYNYSW